MDLPSNLIGKIIQAHHPLEANAFESDQLGWLSSKTQVWGTLLFIKENELNFTQNITYRVHYLH